MENQGNSDADFVGDKETRISATGYVIYFMNVPICWRSRGQKGVTLSTTEAENVACSEVVKELLFIVYLLRHMKIEVELPIHVNVNNIRAIIRTAVIILNRWIYIIIIFVTISKMERLCRICS